VACARERPRRPDKGSHQTEAITVKSTESYADILRRIRKEVPSGGEVAAIRRTRGGDLLLQMRKGASSTEKLASAISAVAKNASVQRLVPSVVVEIRDLDEATDEKEIIEALGAVNERLLKEAKVIALRPAFGGTQLAVVKLPSNGSEGIIQGGRLRVGWVSCRVRSRAHLPRCFKCREYGHMAADCRSTVDRSKACNRCGTDGHKAANCCNMAFCPACQSTGKAPSHWIGSRGCAALGATRADHRNQK
jgi:hypothetical protein